MHSTTTCSYSNPSIVWPNENGGHWDANIAVQDYPTGYNLTLSPFQFGSSTCVTVSDSAGGGGGGGSTLSTDPVLAMLFATFLVVYIANYVRRLFYS